MVITARSNEKVKRLRKLMSDKSARREDGVYVVEGSAILSEMTDLTTVVRFFVRESDVEKYKDITDRYDAEIVILADDVFDSVADTVTPGGAIAVVAKGSSRFPLGDVALVLDGVSDAGNVGTIVRTAAARGIKNVFCVHACADPFSPKAVRASMGGIFKTDVAECSVEELTTVLSDRVFVALDMAGENVYSYNAPEKIAVVVGNEAHGVSDELKKICRDVVSIPMAKDGVESLNAAVAAGIAMYLIKKGE